VDTLESMWQLIKSALEGNSNGNRFKF
jgi:hypothetical protein